jgi:hypothetical protein
MWIVAVPASNRIIAIVLVEVRTVLRKGPPERA